jgi:hypothetical protein
MKVVEVIAAIRKDSRRSACRRSLPGNAFGAGTNRGGCNSQVPLLKEGRFVANLNVHDRVRRTWRDAEVSLIEAIADQSR